MAWGTGTRGVLAAAMLALWAGIVTAGTATRANGATTAPSDPDPQWRVDSFHETVTVQDNGLLHVTERIVFDFGTAASSGIVQYVDAGPLYAGGPEATVSEVSAQSPDAPAGVAVGVEPGNVSLTIGDANRRVTGAHTYTIKYTVAHAAYADTAQPGTASLLWPAVVSDWGVPMSDIEVTVKMPAAVGAEQCWQGFLLDPATCGAVTENGTAAHFTQPSLTAGQQLTVKVTSPLGKAVGLPSAAAPAYPPTRPDMSRASTMKPFLWVALAGSVVIVIAIAITVAKRGPGRGPGGDAWSGGDFLTGGGDGGPIDSGGGGGHHHGGW